MDATAYHIDRLASREWAEDPLLDPTLHVDPLEPALGRWLAS